MRSTQDKTKRMPLYQLKVIRKIKGAKKKYGYVRGAWFSGPNAASYLGISPFTYYCWLRGEYRINNEYYNRLYYYTSQYINLKHKKYPLCKYPRCITKLSVYNTRSEYCFAHTRRVAYESTQEEKDVTV